MEGRLSSRSYETQGGEKRISMDINLSDVQFLGGGNKGQAPAGVGAADADDLPGNLLPLYVNHSVERRVNSLTDWSAQGA